MNVIVNGLMTNYLKAGNGKKVLVCLHGWGDSSKTFATLAAELSKKYTILAPDLPGFGGTQEPSRSWGVDEYAKFVVDWLNKIGQKNTYGVIGHSNGGAIAISLVGNKFIPAKKVVLISSSGIRDVHKMRRRVLSGGAKIAKLPLKLLPNSAEAKIKRKAYSAIGSDYMLLTELDTSFRKLVGQDMQKTATKIDVPALLIYGDGDRSTPVKYGQLFNEAIPGSRLEVVAGGHFIHQEQASEVAKMVGKFLGV